MTLRKRDSNIEKETQSYRTGGGELERKNKYSQYIGWGVTAFAVIAAGVLFYFGIDYMGKLIDALGKLLCEGKSEF